MKKELVTGFVSCLISAMAFAPAHAQQNNLFTYVSKTHAITPAGATHAERTTYKSYVGVYVRAKVMRTFLDLFGDATDVRWHYNDNDYLASFTNSGRQCRALFDRQGGLVYSMQVCTKNDLPRAVYRLLKSAYIDYTIGAVTEMTWPRRKAWIVNLEDQNSLVVAQVVDGELEEVHRYKTRF